MKDTICNRNQKHIIILLINVILVAAFIAVTIFAKNSIKDLYSQQEAQRWEEKKNSYAQVSAFISPEKGMQTEDISDIRNSVMQTLSEDALHEAEGDARVWIDAYSGECEAEIRKDSNTLSVTAMGVDGVFFQFHPMPLLSGGYISGEDLNQDRIVIDQGVAWKLFGSNDVVGMQVWMGDNVYVIAGVVQAGEDSLEQMAYGKRYRIYMSYDQLKKHQEKLVITCYEAVMPNPITNYAYNTLTSACGLQEEGEEELQQEENPLNFDGIEVIENSKRYKAMTMLSQIKTLKFRGMRTNSIAYPYWENVARVMEEQQMVLLIIRILLLIIPCISLIGWLYHAWTHKSWTVKEIVLRLIEKLRARREEEYLAEQEAEENLALENLEEEEFEYIDSEEESEIENSELEDSLQFVSVTQEDIFNI